MKENLASQYDPKGIETELYEFWEKNGYFKVNKNKDKESLDPYVIVIPPPNVTGFLHMGHALNNTIQDAIIRQKRMEKYDALWVPGTDHAGIATQNVVEKMLADKGIKRYEIGREKFIEEVWKWKEKYGSRIIFQLKALGASCDWDKLRFTMDQSLSKAVIEAFIHLYNKGLIYRGERIINWCPRCTTALSDEEVDYKDEEGHLYYIKYPIVSGGYLVVATTRPETMLGDTAVAVNPKDDRFKHLIGKDIKLPLMNRIIKIIGDNFVDIEFGTGAVKVTPNHDPNDFDIGVRHNLDSVTVIDKYGVMNENAGEFEGLNRFLCREKIIEKLEAEGLLEKIEPYSNRVGCCYRCDTVIEPYLSKQWFVSMKTLAIPAINAAENDNIKFYPDRWKKVYLKWLYEIKDWCISRQIWWGHRIPVWYCNSCFTNDNNEKGTFVSNGKPEKCPFCGSSDIYQETDVLDTWFSSWLWPFSVFGWPAKTEELDTFYPTNTLVTAPDILFFWVARMVMAGYEFIGESPFENIFINGTVRDKTGKKMSKSLGNVIDPVKLIEEYGADSLRFSLISMTALGQDVFLSPTFYIKGRNFTNKIWNASRFILSSVEKEDIQKVDLTIKKEDLNFVDLWLLSELELLIKKVDESMKLFRLNEALNYLYDFYWHYFCDWYLEISKVYDGNNYFKENVLPILFYVNITLMKLLHPFIPFITEKIWQLTSKYCDMETDSIIVSSWPKKSDFYDVESCNSVNNLIEIITTIRDIRTRFRIPLAKNIDCFFEKEFDTLETGIIKRLASIENIKPFNIDTPNIKSLIVKNLTQGKFGISLAGIVDFTIEEKKLQKEKEKLEDILVRIKNKLTNPEFLEKAPDEVISKEEEKRTQIQEKIENIQKDIDFITGGN
ncbi:valine--tRNA ligase [bacterium]|nr:valine--tRNA ligase [bacterium]